MSRVGACHDAHDARLNNGGLSGQWPLDDLFVRFPAIILLNGTDLLDRLRNLVGRLNEWRDYLQGELDAASSLGGVLNFPDDQGNMRDDWQHRRSRCRQAHPT